MDNLKKEEDHIAAEKAEADSELAKSIESEKAIIKSARDLEAEIASLRANIEGLHNDQADRYKIDDF